MLFGQKPVGQGCRKGRRKRRISYLFLSMQRQCGSVSRDIFDLSSLVALAGLLAGR